MDLSSQWVFQEQDDAMFTCQIPPAVHINWIKHYILVLTLRSIHSVHTYIQCRDEICCLLSGRSGLYLTPLWKWVKDFRLGGHPVPSLIGLTLDSPCQAAGKQQWPSNSRVTATEHKHTYNSPGGANVSVCAITALPQRHTRSYCAHTREHLFTEDPDLRKHQCDSQSKTRETQMFCFCCSCVFPLVPLLCHVDFNFRRPLVLLLLWRSIWLKSWGECEAMRRKGSASGVSLCCLLHYCWPPCSLRGE